MGAMHGDAKWPDHFSGLVNLFPLPNLVLFPHVVQPLHIFEPRYCEMLVDALSRDKLIAMALLEPGWEKSFLDRPAISSIVCIGKIINHSATDDGRHNILLAGMKRARIVREVNQGRAFRQAEVELLEDHYPAGSANARLELYQELVETFSEAVPEEIKSLDSFQQLLDQQLPLGMLTDIITFTLRLPLPVKQQILAEPNVDVRCRLLLRCLLDWLHSRASDSPTPIPLKFPPDFSTN